MLPRPTCTCPRGGSAQSYGPAHTAVANRTAARQSGRAAVRDMRRQAAAEGGAGGLPRQSPPQSGAPAARGLARHICCRPPRWPRRATVQPTHRPGGSAKTRWQSAEMPAHAGTVCIGGSVGGLLQSGPWAIGACVRVWRCQRWGRRHAGGEHKEAAALEKQTGKEAAANGVQAKHMSINALFAIATATALMREQRTENRAQRTEISNQAQRHQPTVPRTSYSAWTHMQRARYSAQQRLRPHLPARLVRVAHGRADRLAGLGHRVEFQNLARGSPETPLPVALGRFAFEAVWKW